MKHHFVANRREGGMQGLTMVEMLVVIAVIGVIAALLLPALSKSKSNAAQTRDVGNLKQLMIAAQLFANDNEERMAWPNWGPSSLRPGWLYTADTNAAGPNRFVREKGLLWMYLENAKLYYCPLDKTNTAEFAARGQQLSSYAMNGAVIGYNRRTFPPAKLSDFRPGDIAFWETDEREPNYFNDGANFPSEGVSARHRTGAIRAAFDGSVGFVKFGQWYSQVYDTNRNSIWCYPFTDNGR